MARHLANLTRTGIPVVVSINRFSTDTDRELSSIKDIALANGAREVVLFEGHGKGGEGAVELARSVLESVEGHVSAGRPYNPLVPRDASILEKISTIGTGLYGADSVKFPEDVLMAVERIESWGYGGPTGLHGEDAVLLLTQGGLAWGANWLRVAHT